MNERPSPRPAPPLLHNMSCRPDATVQYTGRDQCIRLCFSFSRLSGHPGLYERIVGARKPRYRPYANLDEAYRAVLERPCPALSCLPPIAGVLRNAPGELRPGITDDPHLALAVLARCTDSVFLRDSVPVPGDDRLFRPATLLLPPSWRFSE